VERIGDPSAPRRAIFLHGAGGHAAALWPFAAFAARRGVHVVVPDPARIRPHPRAAPQRRALPDWVTPACAFLRAERAAHRGPLLLVGASLGQWSPTTPTPAPAPPTAYW
jgi:alpha-beta hydrolase superfamily lysophospholipase